MPSISILHLAINYDIGILSDTPLAISSILDAIFSNANTAQIHRRPNDRLKSPSRKCPPCRGTISSECRRLSSIILEDSSRIKTLFYDWVQY